MVILKKKNNALAMNVAISNYHESKILSEKEVLDKIVSDVCSFYDLRKEKVLSRLRWRELVRARVMIIQLMLCSCEISQKELGVLVGGLHHSTIIHARLNWENYFDTDEKFREDWRTLNTLVSSRLNIYIKKMPTRVSKVSEVQKQKKEANRQIRLKAEELFKKETERKEKERQRKFGPLPKEVQMNIVRSYQKTISK